MTDSNVLSPLIEQKHVLQAMRTAFPHANVSMKPRMGGMVFCQNIWQFEVSISLTTQAISLSDTQGEVRITFRLLPRRTLSDRALNPITLLAKTTTDMQVLYDTMHSLRDYANRIVDTIRDTFRDTESEEADVLGGDS